jgi:hypothetical protein
MVEPNGLQRNPIDKYYTKPEIVKKCAEWIFQWTSISKENDLVIEPSAGNGAFLSLI